MSNSSPQYARIMDYPHDSVQFRVGKIMHEDHVKKLCQLLKSESFTTEQYRAFIDADLKSRFERMKKFNYPTEYARRCLEGYGVAREVEPDLWALLY